MGVRKYLINHFSAHYTISVVVTPREKITERGKIRYYYLGRTIRADFLGQIFLGSQKTSQMAAYVLKSIIIDLF